MSDTEFLPPFLKWGDYKSKDPQKPDIVEIRVIEPETFQTEFSACIRAEVKRGEEWREEIIPIKSNTSRNASCLTKWTDLVKKGKIEKGSHCIIKTYLGVSKNKHDIRRFAISVR